MSIFKLVAENLKLKLKTNTLENKCEVVNEELLSLYREKNTLLTEREYYKEAAQKSNNEVKELKKEVEILERRLQKQDIKLNPTTAKKKETKGKRETKNENK